MSNSDKKRRVVQSEGRGIIAKVFHFLQDEYNFMKANNFDNCDLSPLVKVRKRTAEATGVSESTVSKILKEEKELPSTSSKFATPLKNRKRDNKFDLSNIKTDVIRSTIQNFHIVHKEIPTLIKLQTLFKENHSFDGCLSTLRTLLITMGYKWRKIENSRKILQENHSLQFHRIQYLKKIRQFRSDSRPIVYTGDTPFFKNRVTGTRSIIMHAGTKNGFIQNATLVYQANSAAGDYHSGMSYDNFCKWIEEKLLPNLPEKAVIVMDSANYNNAYSCKIPTSNSRKKEMQEWLAENGIPYNGSLCKIELYDLIKKHKERVVTFKVEDLIRSHGYDTLRLPRCHPELNAIKQVFDILKNLFTAKNIGQNMIVVEHLIEECLTTIDNNNTWASSCDHVKNIEVEYMNYLDCDINYKLEFVNRISLYDSSDEKSDNDSLLEVE